MKRFALGLILLVALVGGLSLVHAQETRTCTTNPNDGSRLPECFTRDDNECYTGGVLEGQCDSEWEWIAGWYLARFNRGLISRDQFPAEYSSLLPTVGSTDAAPPATPPKRR